MTLVFDAVARMAAEHGDLAAACPPLLSAQHLAPNHIHPTAPHAHPPKAAPESRRAAVSFQKVSAGM